jgi:hypothetical protein
VLILDAVAGVALPERADGRHQRVKVVQPRTATAIVCISLRPCSWISVVNSGRSDGSSDPPALTFEVGL